MSSFGTDHEDIESVMSGVSQRYGKTKYRDTISELYDNDEKDAVFRSSMKKGGAVHDFNMSYKPPV